MALIRCKDCHKEYSTDAKRCPHCGAKKAAKQLSNAISAVIIFVFIAWGISEIINNSSTTNVSQSVQSQAPDDGFVKLPADEQRFIQTVQSFQTQTDSAPNDMLLGILRHKRKMAICGLLHHLEMNNWRGKIKELSSNGDGKGVLSVSLANNIIVGTTNNAFSDSLLPARTLIDQESPIAQKASAMKEGDPIIFSGKGLPSDLDCMMEQSMTLRGAMSNPEFLITFFSVTKP